ncbi:MAG: magnesium transporter [Candidatus Heimdallarchaeota archaeon]
MSIRREFRAWMKNATSKSSMEKFWREALLALLILVLVDAIAGTALGEFTDMFLSIPGLLILVPAVAEMRGNISGILAGRLSTALHLGSIYPKLRGNTIEFQDNVIATAVLSVLTPIGVGIIAFFFSRLFAFDKSASWGVFILVSLCAGVISGVFQTIITIIFAFVTYKRGLDPDTIVFPILSSLGDIITILSLIISVIFISQFGRI